MTISKVKTPEPSRAQGFQNTKQSTQADSTKDASFIGTSNPRHMRVLHALQSGPCSREVIDRRGGCSNGPQLIAELRDLGLDLPCASTACSDRDGRIVQRGTYYLTSRDQRMVRAWKSQRQHGGAAC